MDWLSPAYALQGSSSQPGMYPDQQSNRTTPNQLSHSRQGKGNFVIVFRSQTKLTKKMENLKSLWGSLPKLLCWYLTTCKYDRERKFYCKHRSKKQRPCAHIERWFTNRKLQRKLTNVPFSTLRKKTTIKMRLWGVIQRAWATEPERSGLLRGSAIYQGGIMGKSRPEASVSQSISWEDEASAIRWLWGLTPVFSITSVRVPETLDSWQLLKTYQSWGLELWFLTEKSQYRRDKVSCSIPQINNSRFFSELYFPPCPISKLQIGPLIGLALIAGITKPRTVSQRHYTS